MSLMDEFNEIAELAYAPTYLETLEEPIGKCFNCGNGVYEDTLYKEQDGMLFDSFECYNLIFYAGEFNDL